ncbi:hypothetical protein [Hugenholtzia roseola]|uniref:hypothetical protein n=1 Tax=Hugenholtzia roseola TaxID=1002 RepID=UPI0004287307|nr:hypothetical protein [Hugenholtzia roseola]
MLQKLPFKKIKSLLIEIAERELVNNVGENIAAYSFPNPATLCFLAKLICRRQPFGLVLLNKVGSYEIRYESGLILHQKNKVWYLGNYQPNRKRHFSNFKHFFPSLLRRLPLYFTLGKEIALIEYSPHEAVFPSVLEAVTNWNHQFLYDYHSDFVNLIATFANTGIKLQIIIEDTAGDFYITTSRIWVRSAFPQIRVFFENTNFNARQPDFIRSGNYLGIENRIIQIKYKNKILYSKPAFTTKEKTYRKNHIWNLIARFHQDLGKAEP